LPDFFKPEFIKDDLLDEEFVTDEIKRTLQSIGSQKDVAIFVKINDSVDRVLHLANEDSLIVSGYVENISKELVKKSKSPVLIVKNDYISYEKLIMPVDLSEDSKSCVDKARELFEGAKIRIVYDYRYPYEMMVPDVNFMDMPIYDPVFDKELNDELKKSSYDRYYKFLDELRVDGDFIEGDLDVDEDLKEYASKRGCELFFICKKGGSEIMDRSVVQSLVEKIDCDLFVTNI
jgi:nucleotide-binding universal stress UspA family protein